MSDLRGLYYKALVDPVPQSVNDLAKRYQSLRTAILNDSKKREKTYNILFKYTDIKTLLQVLEAEKNQHISALDEIFYKLTRGIEVLEEPVKPKEYEPKTAVMAAYLAHTENHQDIEVAFSRRDKDIPLEVESIRAVFSSEYKIDYSKHNEEGFYIFCFFCAAGSFTIGSIFYPTLGLHPYVIFWFVVPFIFLVFCVVAIKDRKLKANKDIKKDIEAFLHWEAEQKEYTNQRLRYFFEEIRLEIQLEKQMEEEQTKPGAAEETAGIDL